MEQSAHYWYKWWTNADSLKIRTATPWTRTKLCFGCSQPCVKTSCQSAISTRWLSRMFWPRRSTLFSSRSTRRCTKSLATSQAWCSSGTSSTFSRSFRKSQSQKPFLTYSLPTEAVTQPELLLSQRTQLMMKICCVARASSWFALRWPWLDKCYTNTNLTGSFPNEWPWISLKMKW